jgi:hypothetical protein
MRTIGQAHSLVHQNGVMRIQTDIRVGTRLVPLPFAFYSYQLLFHTIPLTPPKEGSSLCTLAHPYYSSASSLPNIICCIRKLRSPPGLTKRNTSPKRSPRSNPSLLPTLALPLLQVNPLPNCEAQREVLARAIRQMYRAR